MSAPSETAAGIYVFRMPSLGADMEAGTLMQWLIAPGDRVSRGDIVAVVDTEKADIEVEIFASGVVSELLVGVGTRVPVGTPLARLRTEEVRTGEVPAEPKPAVVPAEPKPSPEVPAEPKPSPEVPAEPPGGRFLASPAARARAATLGLDLHYVTGTGPGGAVVLRDVEQRARQPEPAPHRLHVHPVARKMAEELGIDLTQVTGTGVGHAVTKADVERAAAIRRTDATRQAPVTPAPRVPRGLRQALAAAMSRSNREIPHYYLGEEIDLERALAWLARTNAERPVTERLLPAALLLKAVALAAREVPEMNGFWVDGAFRPAAQVHLGVAVSRRNGEVVIPALHDADTLSLDRLMVALRDLVQRARAGSLRSSEVADATLTVTNLGDLGATSVFGVIYPPQTALVGFGRITARPWVEDGKVVARQAVTATLAADHRASDGYRGGRFLARIGELLADPDRLAGS